MLSTTLSTLTDESLTLVEEALRLFKGWVHYFLCL